MEDVVSLSTIDSEMYSWGLDLYTASALWGSLYLANAVSGISMESGGYGLYLECQQGCMLIFLGGDPKDGGPDLSGFSPGQSLWFPIMLQKGDQL